MDAVRYVALGDSYTIGTSVLEHERWPNQLVERIRDAFDLALTANLGVNGYTSSDVIEEELPALARLMPNFVTLLVGVNDVVQRVPESAYRANVEHILDTLADVPGRDRTVAVSTPDYTLSPQGAAFGEPSQQRAEIARFNSLMAAACSARGIRFVSIDAAANRVSNERGLVAQDGLHPNGAQYKLWVDAIAPVVFDALSGRPRP